MPSNMNPELEPDFSTPDLDINKPREKAKILSIRIQMTSATKQKFDTALVLNGMTKTGFLKRYIVAFINETEKREAEKLALKMANANPANFNNGGSI